MLLNLKKVVACAACLLVTGQTMASAQRFKLGRGPSLAEQTVLNREWARELLERQVLDTLIVETSTMMPDGVLMAATFGVAQSASGEGLKPTGNMAYWRGRAYWDIGLFGDAEMDLLGLQNNYAVRVWRVYRDTRGTEPYRYARPEFMRFKELRDVPQWGDRNFFVRGKGDSRESGPMLNAMQSMTTLIPKSKSKSPEQQYAEMPLKLWDPELRASLPYLKRLEEIKPLLPRRSTMLPHAEPAYYGTEEERKDALPVYFQHDYWTQFEIRTKITENGGHLNTHIPMYWAWLNQGRGNLRGGLNIYHDEDAAEDEWTQGVMSTLEKSYEQAKSSVLGADAPLVTVFIFSDRARYDAFFKEYHGGAPKAQEWITYNRGVMMLCPRNSQGVHIAPDDITSDYFRSTIAQVYSHCLLRRALGTTQVPSWLNNGLAMTLAGKLVPEDEKLNDYAINRLVAANALLDLETLAKVPASTQYMTDKDDATKGALQQSYHMTRYLLQSSKKDGIVSFFNRAVNNEQTIEQAFEETYGCSPEAFYAAWYASVQKTYGSAASRTSAATQPTSAVPSLN